jgi:hypothetical protein
MRIVVVGGGAAGFSAAMVAKSVGVDEVVIVERMDTLGGLALVAGIGLCGAGAFSVLAEEKALGGARLYTDVLLPIATHSEISMPGFDRAMLYSVTKLDARMRRVLDANGIDVRLGERVTGVKRTGATISTVILGDGTEIVGHAFVDATGSVTGIPGCTEFGSGCVECVLRCLMFGDPKGLVDGEVELISSLDGNGRKGVTGTSYLLPIGSLSEDVQEDVNRNGYAYLSVPPNVKPDMARARKAGSYSMAIMSQDVVKEKLLLTDVGGYVKVTANAAPRFAGVLRQIPGLEDSMIAQPLAGHKGHLVEGLAILPRENTLQVKGFDNLFCGGIKSGHALFLLDVVCSGDLAGYNAVRKAKGKACLELPKTLAVGSFIDHVGSLVKTKEGLQQSPQADEITLKKLGVYRENEAAILEAVSDAGLRNIYRQEIN